MDHKKINKLILASYDGNSLDPARVNKIASLLNKSDLKRYINGLKVTEKKRCLFVSSPINNHNVKKFEKLFPNKRIIFKKTPSLMLGMQIVDDDNIYQFTLKNTLEEMVNHIMKNYD